MHRTLEHTGEAEYRPVHVSRCIKSFPRKDEGRLTGDLAILIDPSCTLATGIGIAVVALESCQGSDD